MASPARFDVVGGLAVSDLACVNGAERYWLTIVISMVVRGKQDASCFTAILMSLYSLPLLFVHISS